LGSDQTNKPSVASTSGSADSPVDGTALLRRWWHRTRTLLHCRAVSDPASGPQRHQLRTTKRRPLPGGAVAVFAMLLVVYGNAVALPHLPEWVVFLLNLGVGILVVLAAGRFGYSVTEIGLSTDAWRRGWKPGVAISALILLGVAIAAGLHLVSADPAVQGMPFSILAWQVLIRIPIGTALFEETMFRGVLYTAGQRSWGGRGAVLGSSVAFALWHVIAEMHRQERQGYNWGSDAATAAIPVLVFLFFVGVVLCCLRRRTGGVFAPMIVHWAANAIAAIAVYLVSN
jgi:membrane protease YdiL (CAAX protease family)